MTTTPAPTITPTTPKKCEEFECDNGKTILEMFIFSSSKTLINSSHEENPEGITTVAVVCEVLFRESNESHRQKSREILCFREFRYRDQTRIATC